MLEMADVEALTAALRQAARDEIMPRFRPGVDARRKTGPGDLVTEADVEAERALQRWAKDAYPHALFVGEEAVESAAVDASGLADAAFAIVVDPVDGTVNFASGTPLFVSMAAILIKGRAEAGVILDPVLDRAYLALRGGGAWLDCGDGSRAPLAVAPPAALEDAAGIVDGWSLGPERRRRLQNAMEPARTLFGLRCSGHEYRLLATGGADFMVAPGLLKPWDHAPGLLLLREAGGVARLVSGDAYEGAAPARTLVCGTDARLVDALTARMRAEGF